MCALSIAPAYGQNIPSLEGEFKSQWYNLNHYNARGTSGIRNDDFFIAPDGRENPRSEYEHFIKTLLHYKQGNKDVAQTLCNFPARMTLMQENLNWFSQNDRPSCPEYEQAQKPDQIKSISLIFASGYFDNPSSYYGHTLLRFNYDDSVLNQKTLNSSLNYGANITDQDGTLVYILKGLFGGYSARYVTNNDFIHSHRYTNAQLRDLWEYELNLTPKQLHFVSEHSWELKNAEFKYYFMNDNCAHRVINIVERATGEDLTKSHGFWLMPLQVLQETEKNEAKLIRSESYNPSLKSTFSARYDALSDNERRQFLSFLSEDTTVQRKLAPQMSEDVLLLLIEQLDIQIAKLSIKKTSDRNLKNALNAQRRIILFELLKRPAYSEKDRFTPPAPKASVLDMPSVSVLRTGYIRRADEIDALNIHYQVANNDLLDRRQPGQEKSRFIMGAVNLDIRESNQSGGRVDVREVTVFDIANLNTNPLPMTHTGEYSWGIKFGYSHRNEICTACGSVSLEGKGGKAIRFNDHIMAYSLNGVRLNHRKTRDFGYTQIVSENGLAIDAANARFDLSFDATYDPFMGEDEFIAGAEVGLDVGKGVEARFGAAKNFDGDNMISARIGYHFN
ncbi:MAG: DUF4105 domain-containing protein [Micavibrio sp.]|nr:DUF4105 domain-containing protein [Micavibrio sp.]